MSEFKREERYVVLKLKHMTQGVKDHLYNNILAGDEFNQFLTECVVVESDWPIYEQVWDMVQRMAEDRPQQADSIALLNLLSKIRWACGDNGFRMQDELVDHIADISKKVKQLQATNKKLLEALEYSCNYLDENKLNSIGSGSKAHMEMKEAITNAKQQDNQERQ